jgi:MFS family permease
VDRDLRLLSIGVAVRTLGSALYAPFLVLSLYELFGIGYLEIGILVVLLGLAQLPFVLLGGTAADRFGRSRLILAGLPSEAGFTAILAVAFALHDLDLVVLDAFVAGMLGAFTGPAFSAYIADLAVGSVRTQAFSWYRIAFNAGFSAGVTLGGLLLAAFGFTVAVAVAAIVIGTVALLLAVALGSSPYDLRLREGAVALRTPATSPPHAARGGPGTLTRLLRDRTAMELAVAFALASFVASQWSVIFPLFVHNVLGVGYALLGIGLALNGLVVVLGQSATTSWSIGRRHTSLAAVGLVLYCAAFLVLGVVGTLGWYVGAIFLVAVVVLTFGENLLAIPATTLPSNLAPADAIGGYNGAFQLFGQLGFLASTLAGGVVLAAALAPWLLWVVLALPAVPALLLLGHAGHRLPEGPNTA